MSRKNTHGKNKHSGSRLIMFYGSCGASQVVLVVKNWPANAGDAGHLGLITGLGRSPGGGQGNPFQYFCLENSIDRRACQVTVHGVTKSQTRLSDFTFTYQWLKSMALR